MSACANCELDVPDEGILKIEFLGDSVEVCSLQCAVAALSIVCEQCRCPVLGVPLVDGDDVYCSADCAERAGVDLEAPAELAPL